NAPFSNPPHDLLSRTIVLWDTRPALGSRSKTDASRRVLHAHQRPRRGPGALAPAAAGLRAGDRRGALGRPLGRHRRRPEGALRLLGAPAEGATQTILPCSARATPRGRPACRPAARPGA